MTARAKMMQIGGHHLFLSRRAGTVGGSKGRGTGFAVPRHLTIFRRTADGQRPDAVRVTIAIAVVVIPATVS